MQMSPFFVVAEAVTKQSCYDYIFVLALSIEVKAMMLNPLKYYVCQYDSFFTCTVSFQVNWWTNHYLVHAHVNL